MGAPYQRMPFPPRALQHIFELNPLGTVPPLLDGSTRMTSRRPCATWSSAATRTTGTLAVRPTNPASAPGQLAALRRGHLTFP
jgi:hypothetical protein